MESMVGACVLQEEGDSGSRAHTRSPKIKLIVLLFLTLPHPVDCLSCVKDIMIIKFGDVVHLDKATGSRYHFFLFCFVLFFCLYFFAVFICSFMTGT